MGKKKKEKVVDLKPEKISEEQLKKVQQIVNMMNRGQMDIGIMETRKHKIMHDIAAIQEQLTAMQGDFEKEYGTYDINIQDGTINYPKENGKANS